MRFIDVLKFESGIIELLKTHRPESADELNRFSDDMHKAVETAISEFLTDNLPNCVNELPDIYNYRELYK